MKKMNIITSLAVDANDTSFNYQLYYLNNKKKEKPIGSAVLFVLPHLSGIIQMQII